MLLLRCTPRFARQTPASTLPPCSKQTDTLLFSDAQSGKQLLYHWRDRSAEVTIPHDNLPKPDVSLRDALFIL